MKQHKTKWIGKEMTLNDERKRERWSSGAVEQEKRRKKEQKWSQPLRHEIRHLRRKTSRMRGTSYARWTPTPIYKRGIAIFSQLIFFHQQRVCLTRLSLWDRIIFALVRCGYCLFNAIKIQEIKINYINVA